MQKSINIYIKIFILPILFISSCSSESASEKFKIEDSKAEINIATLQTNEAEAITALKATVWGKLSDDGGSSVVERGVCYGITENPTYEGSKVKASVVKGSGEFKSELSNLQGSTVYYARAYGVNNKGVGYGNQISFKTESLASPLLVIEDIKVAGAFDIFLDVTLKEHGDLEITEMGLVFNTTENPTVANNKITNTKVESSYKQRISNLNPSTLYYFRPYALTAMEVLYGEEVSLSTIKKGNFTYTLNKNNADDATVSRLKVAFDLAIDYYNKFTSIEKHVTVNYSSGTPTADGNFNGWINMGANSNYQRAGTAMHEMAHTVGVGQHSKYKELMYDGKWHGTKANEILKMMTNSPDAYIKGDATHFWPYGINGAHEDSGSSELYMIHALIIQGMKTDGLPSN